MPDMMSPMDDSGAQDMRAPVRRMLSEKYAHYKRVGQIVGAISHFGFGRVWDAGAMLNDMGMDAEERQEILQMKTSVRFRLMLEGLGPTFIKLGQMLSTRPDLVPEDVADELGKLRGDVAPVPFAQARDIVEAELGKKLADVFKSFDEKPMAAASIGQVHRAVLKGSNETVAVKVQRPDVADIVKVDMEILRELASVLNRSFSSMNGFDAKGILDEFERMLVREMDYTVEARNIRRFAQNFKDMPEITFPKVHWKLCTRRVLTMQFMDGVPLDNKKKLAEWKIDPKKLTDVLGRAYIQMIFVDGFFHADPHHGNIFALRDGRVCLLDFGAIGFLDDASRNGISRFYMSLMRGNVHGAAEALLALSGASEADVRMQDLEWDLRDFLDYTRMKKEKIEVPPGMNQRILAISRRQGVVLPASFVLFERSMAEIEGVCRSLDPGFDVMEVAKANLETLIKAHFNPRPDPLEAAETAKGYRDLARALPGRVDKVLRKVERDELTVKVDPALFSDLRANIRKMGMILAVSIVAAALIFYIAYAGSNIELEFLETSVGVGAVVFIWLVAVVVIYRRM